MRNIRYVEKIKDKARSTIRKKSFDWRHADKTRTRTQSFSIQKSFRSKLNFSFTEITTL